MAERRKSSIPAVSDAPAEAARRKAALVPTYYPDSTDPDAGIALKLGSGETQDHIDIRLATTANYCADGTVRTPMGAGSMRFLVERDRARMGGVIVQGAENGVTSSDGRFRICDLSPGSYWLSARQASPSLETAPMLFGTPAVCTACFCPLAHFRGRQSA